MKRVPDLSATTPNPHAIHHVGLTVSDLDASLGFYRDLLGFRVRFRRENVDKRYARRVVGLPNARWSAAMVQPPHGGMVELIQYHVPPGAERVVAPNDVGTVHVAFQVVDLEETYRKLAGAGVVFISEPQEAPSGSSKGMKFVYCRDPDGIIVELVEVASNS